MSLPIEMAGPLAFGRIVCPGCAFAALEVLGPCIMTPPRVTFRREEDDTRPACCGDLGNTLTLGEGREVALDRLDVSTWIWV